MNRYRILWEQTVNAFTYVDAESEKEALEKAREQLEECSGCGSEFDIYMDRNEVPLSYWNALSAIVVDKDKGVTYEEWTAPIPEAAK
jgi:hypothetical protein